MGIVKNEGKVIRVEGPVKNGDVITVTYYLSHAPKVPFQQHFMPDGRETMADVEEQATHFARKMHINIDNAMAHFDQRALRGMLSSVGVYNL